MKINFIKRPTRISGKGVKILSFHSFFTIKLKVINFDVMKHNAAMIVLHRNG